MTTKHTHKPNFGKRVNGCPRCDELNNGAEPVTGWTYTSQIKLTESKHVCTSKCGPVCTANQW
ncbi:MAG TPA: hypothetical protein VIY48_14260 [Candidatus Paceibacterota bacterium]